DSHRVLDESLGDVPQQAGLEIAPSAERVHELARVALRNRVDRQIAAPQILLEGDIGRELRLEAAIARSDLALEARERVLLMRLGVQEHRELAPDRREAARDELGAIRADYDPVPLAYRAAEESVPHGPAHQVDLHADMLT